VVLPAAVHVDGLIVDEERRRGPVHLTHHARPGPLFHDDEVVDGGVAQAHLFGRVGISHPVVATLGGVQDALLRQQVQELGAVGPELLDLVEGQLEGGALQVADADDEVVRVDEPGLGRRFEQVLRVVGQVLVEGSRVATSTAKERPFPRPARPICCQVLARLPG
jgi:hypothetical protein